MSIFTISKAYLNVIDEGIVFTYEQCNNTIIPKSTSQQRMQELIRIVKYFLISKVQTKYIYYYFSVD